MHYWRWALNISVQKHYNTSTAFISRLQSEHRAEKEYCYCYVIHNTARNTQSINVNQWWLALVLREHNIGVHGRLTSWAGAGGGGVVTLHWRRLGSPLWTRNISCWDVAFQSSVSYVIILCSNLVLSWHAFSMTCNISWPSREHHCSLMNISMTPWVDPLEYIIFYNTDIELIWRPTDRISCALLWAVLHTGCPNSSHNSSYIFSNCKYVLSIWVQCRYSISLMGTWQGR